MPAIALEPTRRILLLAAIAACLRADAADDVWEVLGAMAAGLSAGHPEEFLGSIDRGMAGFQDLRANVTALLAQSEVQSSIELVDNQGDDRKRTVEADWLLRVQSRDPVPGSVSREERVKCSFEKRGKRWLVTGITPSSFFSPLPSR